LSFFFFLSFEPKVVKAWRRGSHTAFDPAAVAAKAVTSSLHTAAVLITPKSEGPRPSNEDADEKASDR
jgi:hypothetical protein